MASEAPSGGRRLSRIGILLAIGSAGYLGLLWIGTHLPGNSAPQVGHFDKVMHAGAYFGLAILVMTTCVQFLRPSLMTIFAVIGILLVLAVGDELLQIPVPGRNADVLDFFADMAGIISGVVLVTVVARMMRSDSA
ncbi:MAG: VanZ family protein [bacterium]|nr:VanZ family protein [bacterium]